MKKLALVLIISALVSNSALALNECIDATTGNFDTPQCTSGKLDVNVATGTDSVGKDEDAAHTTGDTGSFILGVYGTGHAALSGNVGDYTPIAVTAAGEVITTTKFQEDEGIGNGDDLFLSGAVRDDALTSGANANADLDAVPLITDGFGKLWTTGGGEVETSIQAIATDTGAYADGDYINDADTITSIASVGVTGEDHVTILDIVVSDEGKEGKNLEIWFFNANPSGSTFTDNGAFTLIDADLVKTVCVVPITQHFAAADNGVSVNHEPNCAFELAGTAIYMAIVAGEAVTFDAADAVQLAVTYQVN